MTMREFYEEEAQRFNIWDHKSDKRNQTVIKEQLRYHVLLSYIPTRTHILDLGCGSGYMSWLMAQKNNTVTAVDISETRMEQFADIAKKNSIEQIVGDFMEIELPAFDGIICQEVLEHIPDYKVFLEKCHATVKEGGFGLFCVPNKEDVASKLVLCPYCLKSIHPRGHLHGFHKETFKKTLMDTGFSIENIFVFCSTRTVNLHKMLNLTVSKKSIYIDRLQSRINPDRCSYLAAFVRKT